ncbi:MAG: anthranilate synthase component I, partial [Phycisphaerae bacterium]
MKHYWPSFEEFTALAERGNTVPVYRQLLADALTPVMAYERLARLVSAKPAGNAFLLESVVGGERIARFSFAAADPEITITARRDEMTIRRRDGGEEAITTHDPLAEMGRLLDDYRHVHISALPRFTGGLVGYAAYDLIRYYEDLGNGPPDDRDLPDLSFGLYRTMVIFDHVSKTIKVTANAHVRGDPRRAYLDAVEAIERTISVLREGRGRSVGEISLRDLPAKGFQSNFTREEYMK